MSVQDRILSSASQNDELLSTLAQTDYAPSAIEQNNAYIQSLKDEIQELEKLIRRLQARTAFEKADHEKYRDSTMRRLAYKIGGKKEKFDHKAEKEEKEYFEALQKELKSKRNLDLLKHNLREAEHLNVDLQSIVEEHQDTQNRLDNLYDSIFQGPTPEFPEEDAKEGPRLEAQQAFNALQLRLSTEKQALAILNDTHKFLQRALSDMNEALDASEMDVWGVGGSFADMAERSALSRAQSHVSQVEMLYAQAQRTQPLITPLPHMEVAMDNMMSDVIFDNVFSDMHFHRKIEASNNQMLAVKKVLDIQIQLAKERVTKAQSEVDGVKRVLEGLRSELQAIRAAAFEKIAGGAPPAYMPPPYEAWVCACWVDERWSIVGF